MADFQQETSSRKSVNFGYKDMGDGSFALVVWTANGGGGGGGGGGDASAANQLIANNWLEDIKLACENSSDDLQTILDRTPVLVSGKVPVVMDAMPLAAGAATATLQGTGNTSLASLDTKASATNTALTTLVGQTDGIEGSLSSLDTKATANNASLVTLVNQTDGIESSLTSLDTKGTARNASLASIDGKATTTNTALATLVSQTDGVEGSLVSLDGKATVNNASLASMDGKLPALVGGRIPVVVEGGGGDASAANQTTQIARLDTLVSQTDAVETSLASIDGKATAGNASLASLDTKATAGNASTASLDTKATAGNASTAAVAAALGTPTAAAATTTDATAAVGIALWKAMLAAIGFSADAAVAAGAAGSLAAKFRLMTTQLATIITNTGNAATGVATGATATLTQPASSLTTAVFSALNLNRKGWAVYNDSTANLLIAFAATTTATAYTVKVPAGQYYEIPFRGYTGIISGLWDAVNGSARVTEIV